MRLESAFKHNIHKLLQNEIKLCFILLLFRDNYAIDEENHGLFYICLSLCNGHLDEWFDEGLIGFIKKHIIRL